MRLLKIIGELYFKPNKFLKKYKENDFHIRSILNFLFVVTLILRFFIFLIKGQIGTRQIMVSIIATFLSVYIGPLFDVFIIWIINKCTKREDLHLRDYIFIVLPHIISGVIVLLLQNVLLLTSLYDIYVIKILYARFIYLFGILDMLYYLCKIFNYQRSQLIVVMIIFSILYIIL